MSMIFSKTFAKDYLLERIEFLERVYEFNKFNGPYQLKSTDNKEKIIAYGEYTALIQALKDLFKIVY